MYEDGTYWAIQPGTVDVKANVLYVISLDDEPMAEHNTVEEPPDVCRLSFPKDLNVDCSYLCPFPLIGSSKSLRAHNSLSYD